MSRFARSFRWTPARLGGLLVALTLVLVGASQAMATVRYAVPGGNTSDPNCFAKSSNCSGQHALDVALANDEVVFATGTYDTGSAGLVKNANVPQDIHGEDGQPPPRIISTSSYTFRSCVCVYEDDTSISHMTFENHGTGIAFFFVGGNNPAHPLVVDNVQAVGSSTGIFLYLGNTVLTNTSAFANATNGVGIVGYGNSTIRGVTAIAPASGGVAFQQIPPGSTSLAIIRNAIL